MLTDLVQIDRLGRRKEAENKRFRAWLKRHAYSPRRLRRLAEEVESQIDCTSCANCCREGEAGVSNHDIEKLAKFVGTSREEFREKFTMRASDNELILKRTDKDGCVFLEGNRCSVYEARPGSCVHYPHLSGGPGSLATRLWLMPERATYCPIVYNWAEVAKREMGYR